MYNKRIPRFLIIIIHLIFVGTWRNMLWMDCKTIMPGRKENLGEFSPIIDVEGWPRDSKFNTY